MLTKRTVALVGLLVALCTFAVAADSPYRSFSISWDGKEYTSPDSYTATKVYSGEMLGCGALNDPIDFDIDEQGNFYLLDSGNNRVVITDSRMQMTGEISVLQDKDGNEDSLYKPSSIFVRGQTVYIADTGNERALKLDISGRILQTYTRPEVEMYAEEALIPLKILADADDNVYVIAQNVYQGIMVYQDDGTFTGYYGSPPVTVTLDLLVDKFWKNFMSEEQISGISKYVPIEYSSFTWDPAGYIYAVISNTQNYQEQLRKLNTRGNNIFPYTKNFGESETVYYDRATWTNNFVDVAVYGDNIYLLDAKWNRIYVYDSLGNRLACFGTIGEQKGSFKRASAICVSENGIFVLDRDNAVMTCFKPTRYGAAILEASALYRTGSYEEALEPWKTVLSMDVHNELAYNGIGEAYLQTEEYEKAVNCFRLSGNRERESVAFSYLRAEVLRQHIAPLTVLVLVLATLATLFSSRRILDRLKQWRQRRAQKESRFAFVRACRRTVKMVGNIMTKPIVHFQEIKFVRYSNWWLVLVILVLWILVKTIHRQAYSVRFSNFEFDEYNLLVQIGTTVLPYLLFCVTNWLVCSITDGEGKFREIATYTAISLVPYILSMLLVAMLSSVLVLEEAIFLHIVQAIGVGWSAILLFHGLRLLHNYSGGKTIFSVLLTICGIAVILIVLVLIFALIQQVVDFVSTIYAELIFRR